MQTSTHRSNGVRGRLWWLVISLVVGLGLGLPLAGAQAQSPTPEILRIATKNVPPFVFVDGDQVSGFSIDLWAEIARRANLRYEWVLVDTVAEQIDDVAAGNTDVAIGAISMTPEREAQIDFSYPFYDSGLQILVPTGSSFNLLEVLGSFFSWQLLQVILALLGVIVVVAHIVWLVERNRPETDFPKEYLKGVGEAIWWSAVTVTTVGYGDRTPKGVLGRIVGLLWMFAGLFIIAQFTAAITARATLNEIQGAVAGPDDLVGKQVVVLAGTTGEAYAQAANLQSTPVATLDEAYARLLAGQADALIYDAPVLIYYATNAGRGQVEVVGPLFNEDSYAIVVAEDSALREVINREILTMVEDGTYQQIHERWFGES